MKLLIQIPCYNESETLPATLACLPQKVPGIDCIEIVVIDDGSSDGTAEIARAHGVRVVRHNTNRGLASAFRTGLEICLRQQADIIVNTDGDNQYPGAMIGQLIEPILLGRADIVVGDREVHNLVGVTRIHKLLHAIGSYVARRLSGISLRDPVCGFRALSRKAAAQVNIVTSFSYTTEMLIQAGRKGLAVTSIIVPTNPKTRESRLFDNIFEFVVRTTFTMWLSYSMAKPLRLYSCISVFLILIGSVPVMRFLLLFFSGEGGGHIQSLIFGAVFFTIGFITLMIGLVAELTAVNRHLIEQALEYVRELEHGKNSKDPVREELRVSAEESHRK